MYYASFVIYSVFFSLITREASRLESEVRRVEKSAGGGAEIRERARLAAAAHVHERRLAAAELQHTNQELHNAKGAETLC